MSYDETHSKRLVRMTIETAVIVVTSAILAVTFSWVFALIALAFVGLYLYALHVHRNLTRRGSNDS